MNVKIGVEITDNYLALHLEETSAASKRFLCNDFAKIRNLI